MRLDWRLLAIMLVMFMFFTDGAIVGQNLRSMIEWGAGGFDSVMEFMEGLTNETPEVEEIPS